MENENEPATRKQYVQLTHGEIEAQVAATRCGHCGRPKRPGYAFCTTDFAALPMRYRYPLNKGIDDPFFADGYRAAMQHLVDHPHRQAAFGSFGAWRYNSEDRLYEAGYRLLNHTTCQVPRPHEPGRCCGQRVVWFCTPSNGRICLNFPEYEPHAGTCVDPAYYQRRREEKQLQASAKKRKRA